jgi:hypothetical protein
LSHWWRQETREIGDRLEEKMAENLLAETELGETPESIAAAYAKAGEDKPRLMERSRLKRKAEMAAEKLYAVAARLKAI